MSLPLRIIVRTVLTIGFLWAFSWYRPDLLTVGNGPAGLVIVGILLALLNLLARPLVKLLTAPISLISALIPILLVNVGILYLLERIVSALDPTIVTLTVAAGFWNYLFVALIIGIANWILHILLRRA